MWLRASPSSAVMCLILYCEWLNWLTKSSKKVSVIMFLIFMYQRFFLNIRKYIFLCIIRGDKFVFSEDIFNSGFFWPKNAANITWNDCFILMQWTFVLFIFVFQIYLCKWIISRLAKMLNNNFSYEENHLYVFTVLCFCVGFASAKCTFASFDGWKCNCIFVRWFEKNHFFRW